MDPTESPSSLIFGASPTFRRIVDEIDRYAASPWPVLLLGETGVGKELVARRIHDRSGRQERNFLPVNCASLPHNLFESELFGYERGAFSGANQSQPGLLRSAHRGSIFLDEVGDLELPSQVKLLRFLDSGELRRVGGVRVEQIDVRVIAATNVDLNRLVRARRFRLDLLERICVLTVRIPPLRERTEDIALIARSLLTSLECQFDDAILPRLARYEWPGNVRQLRNVLIRACVLGRFQISETLLQRLLNQERSFAEWTPEEEEDSLWEGRLKEIEKRGILVRLQRNEGNRKRTAKDLGISKSTLHEKLRQWRLEGHETTDIHMENGSSAVSLDPATRR